MDLPDFTEEQLDSLEQITDRSQKDIVAELVNDYHAQVAQQLVMQQYGPKEAVEEPESVEVENPVEDAVEEQIEDEE